MVGGPHAAVAKRGTQQLGDAADHLVRSGSGNWSKKDLPKVLSQPSMPVLSGVGRGTSSISRTVKPPAASSRAIFLDASERTRAPTSAGSPPRSAPTARIAVAIAATLPCPPKLADEAAAGLAARGATPAIDELRLAHPMQRGIGEHRVELGDEVERMSVDLADR